MKATGKVALVSNAATLAAEAVAKRLEEDGFLVLRNYPDGIPEQKKEEINEKYCCAFQTHLLQSVTDMRQWLIDTAGKLHVLVHTDNVIYREKIEDISEENFKLYYDKNAKSAFMTSKVMAEEIAKNGGGSVVYLSSLHDEKPTGVSFTYSAGRGAIKMLCRELALFYGRKNVRCNLIEMDATIETIEQLDSMLIPFNYDITTKISLKKMTKPEDFAGTVSYLVSDDASQVNGAEIRVDGGHLYYYNDR